MAGTNGVVTQICQKYATMAFVSYYFTRYNVSDRVLEFCNDVFSYKYLKKSASYADGRGLGKATEGKLSLDERCAIDQANGIVEDDSYCMFNRAVKDNVVFYARVYTKPKLYDDTCVKLEDKTYGVIEKIIALPGYDNLWAFIKPLRLSRSDTGQ